MNDSKPDYCWTNEQYWSAVNQWKKMADNIREVLQAEIVRLEKQKKSKWIWNKNNKDVKINLETGNRFEYEHTTTGDIQWFKVKFNHYYYDGCKTIDEARAYIDELTEGV